MKLKKNHNSRGDMGDTLIYFLFLIIVVIGIFVSEAFDTSQKEKTKSEAIKACWTLEQIEKLK